MTAQFKGFREADRILGQLPSAVESRVLQRAVNKGATVMRGAIRANAPKGTGEQSPASQKYGRLVANIKTQVLKNKKKKGMRGARVYTKNAFWGRFLEFGTRFIAARPWFRPAFAGAVDTANSAIRAEVGAGIEREAKKLAGQNGIR